VLLRRGSQLSSETDRGEEDGEESTHNRMTNNWTGNSDGRVTAGADAMSIHTICECDNARHMIPVPNKCKTSLFLKLTLSQFD